LPQRFAFLFALSPARISTGQSDPDAFSPSCSYYNIRTKIYAVILKSRVLERKTLDEILSKIEAAAR
jgi:hypothetical protein